MYVVHFCADIAKRIPKIPELDFKLKNLEILSSRSRWNLSSCFCICLLIFLRSACRSVTTLIDVESLILERELHLVQKGGDMTRIMYVKELIIILSFLYKFYI